MQHYLIKSYKILGYKFVFCVRMCTNPINYNKPIKSNTKWMVYAGHLFESFKKICQRILSIGKSCNMNFWGESTSWSSCNPFFLGPLPFFILNEKGLLMSNLWGWLAVLCLLLNGSIKWTYFSGDWNGFIENVINSTLVIYLICCDHGNGLIEDNIFNVKHLI